MRYSGENIAKRIPDANALGTEHEKYSELNGWIKLLSVHYI